MHYEMKGKSQTGDPAPPAVGVRFDNRIDALRSLAALLLREVEALKDEPSFVSMDQNEGRLNLAAEVERIEIEMIRQALILAKGNQRSAAAILGTKATTLHAKIKRYGVEHFSTLGKI